MYRNPFYMMNPEGDDLTEKERKVMEAARQDFGGKVRIKYTFGAAGEADMNIHGMEGKKCADLANDFQEAVGYTIEAQAKPEIAARDDDLVEETVLEPEFMKKRKMTGLGGAGISRKKAKAPKKRQGQRDFEQGLEPESMRRKNPWWLS